MIYTFSAAKKTGEIVKGEREAEDERALMQLLKVEELFLIEAHLKGTRTDSIFKANIALKDILSRIRPVGLVDKMFFTRNLGVMINAGLPLTRALEALAEEATNVKLKSALVDINGSVIKGKSLAESLRAHEKIFGELYSNMVEVGETTGKLVLVFKLLANQMKKDHDLRRRVRGALMYPAIVVSALIGVGIMMMIYVIPALSSTIRDLGVELPITTRVVLGVSDFISAYIFFLLLGFLLFCYLFWRLIHTGKGKEVFDTFILRVPIFGSLIKKFNAARFTRVLAYLLASGVPYVRSLEITSRVLGNSQFKHAADEAVVEIQKGKQLHTVLENHKDIFQPVVIQMIKVGEETGKITDLLLRVALFFEEDVTTTTKNLSTIIEPILMVVIGIMVAFFAVAMLQPIYGSLGNI